ncbi:N-formylglutamate amidohydrolase [Novosphingobium marinum]|nr:N-formylglutamate amidohydrolase [Novosphingobium marinum]GGC17420.1 N-formylglutamate amidohydrolase [Novosphingobium marinum]
MRATGDKSDSNRRTGGRLPGASGRHAFVLSGPEPSPIPVVLAVPHAGRAYPQDLIARMRHPDTSGVRLEDRLVDKVAELVAHETGAMLLVAEAPRAMIDLNRAPDDIDWDMLGRKTPSDEPCYTPSRRARSGLGLVPRRLPGLGEIWKRRLSEDELRARISGVHETYHQCLSDVLHRLRARWGAALLVDVHSMPPLALHGSSAACEFVLGDRFGASCAGSLVANAFGYLGERGRLAAHNRPYAGGYVLERHASPADGIHAMQLEIDRASYLDETLVGPGPGLPGLARLVSGLVRRLASETAELGRAQDTSRWPEAAE